MVTRAVSMTPVAVLPFTEGKIAVRLVKRDDHAYDLLCSLPGHRWDADAKVNVFPLTSLDAIRAAFPRAVLSPQLTLQQQSKEEYTKVMTKQRALVDHIKSLPRAEIKGYAWPFDPFPHQTVGVAFLLSLDRCLLLDEMGLGKSAQAITAACVRMQRGLIDRCLIIAPNTLKFNLAAEIEKHAHPDFRKVVVVNGTKDQRLAQLEEGLSSPFTIINYEAVRLHINELKLIADGQMVVCDEAHKIKNRRAKVTIAVQSLKPRFAVLMTGTPIANKVEDLYTLVDYVSPRLLGKNYWEFEDRYLKKGGWQNKEIVGYKNLDELRDLLSSVSIRRLKSDVLGLPPKTRQDRFVEIDGQQRKAYEAMKEDLVAKIADMDEDEFQATASTILVQTLRLQQIADGFLSDGERVKWVGDAKFKELDDIVDEVVRQNGKKLVIWARFLPVVRATTERYAELGTAMIAGEVATQTRQIIVDRFQDPNDDLRIIVGQIQTASLGLTMTATDVQVFYDCSWSPSENAQAEDRLHRIGQTGSVSVVRLLARETIDERMMKLLERKEQVSKFVAGDIDTMSIRFTRDEILSVL